MNQIFKQFDLFGAFFKPNAFKFLKEYRSNLGGLISIIIFALSLAYLIYNIVIWQMGNFLPTTTISQQKIKSGDYVLESNSIYLSCTDIETQIDAFDPDNMILLPKLQIFENGYPNKDIQYQIKKNEEIQFYEVLIPELNYTINYNNLNALSTQYLFQLQLCNQEQASLLNYTCASTTQMMNFLENYAKFVQLSFTLRQYNEKSKEIDDFKYQNLFILDNYTLFYSQAQIMIQEAIIDDGFLFPSISQKIFSENINIVNQQINQAQITQFADQQTLLFLTLKLHPLQTIKNLQYLKLNELLANVGSIVQLIFYISIVAQYYNSQSFNTHIIDKVISIYYPQFAKYKITKSLIGKMKMVEFEDKQINLTQFLVFYNRVQSIAESKLTVINLIYEISRLQFLCMKFFNNRQLFLDSHNQGLSLPEFQSTKKSCTNLIQIEPKSDLVSISEDPSHHLEDTNQIREFDIDLLMYPEYSTLQQV